MHYQKTHGQLQITIDKPQTLNEWFDSFSISRKYRHLLFETKSITCNHKPIQEEDTLNPGDLLILHLPKEELDLYPNEVMADVVYEDDFVLVVHKPAGIIIHGEDCSLDTMVACYHAFNQIEAPVRHLHRLDKETSGLVLYSKLPLFQAYFDQQIKDKKIHRSYYAITTGNARLRQAFHFQEPIGKDRHVSGKYRVSQTGKPAKTFARCIAKTKQYLLLDCKLETGRTHQIRVHLSHAKHPILNDPLYGIPSKDFKKMCLWAYKLQFTHPLTKETICVQDFWNPDYALIKDAIEAASNTQ